MRESCKHFTGFGGLPTCKAGVRYDGFLPYSLTDRPPCLDPNSKKSCEHATYPTPEEVAEFEQELAVMVQKMNDQFEQWICPHCGAEVLNERQVGRCAYADPCGHRQYQGKARGKRPVKIGRKGGE